MATELLEAIENQAMVPRQVHHDLESMCWVVIWCISRNVLDELGSKLKENALYKSAKTQFEFMFSGSTISRINAARHRLLGRSPMIVQLLTFAELTAMAEFVENLRALIQKQVITSHTVPETGKYGGNRFDAYSAGHDFADMVQMEDSLPVGGDPAEAEDSDSDQPESPTLERSHRISQSTPSRDSASAPNVILFEELREVVSKFVLACASSS